MPEIPAIMLEFLELAAARKCFADSGSKWKLASKFGCRAKMPPILEFFASIKKHFRPAELARDYFWHGPCA